MSRRTEGAVRGEPSLLELSRVATEEDASQIAENAEISYQQINKKYPLNPCLLIFG